MNRNTRQEVSSPANVVADKVNRPLLMTVTWFGSGLSPKGPGTAGSLAALPFAYGIAWLAGPELARLALFAAAVVVFLVGWWASAQYVRKTNAQDPGLIVIDEVAGMWLTLLVAPLNPWSYLFGFIAFRIADIFKPWPVCYFDRTVHGGLGIMLDDLLAAGYAAIGLWVVLYLSPFA